jgi:hypothetical protein
LPVKSPCFAAQITIIFAGILQEEKARADLKQKSLSAAEQDVRFFHAEGRVEKEFVE